MSVKHNDTTLATVKQGSSTLSYLYHGSAQIYAAYTQKYYIKISINNGTIDGTSSSYIEEEISAGDYPHTFRFIPDDYFTYPDDISISGDHSGYTYDPTTGDLSISIPDNLSDDIIVNASCSIAAPYFDAEGSVYYGGTYVSYNLTLGSLVIPEGITISGDPSFSSTRPAEIHLEDVYNLSLGETSITIDAYLLQDGGNFKTTDPFEATYTYGEEPFSKTVFHRYFINL